MNKLIPLIIAAAMFSVDASAAMNSPKFSMRNASSPLKVAGNADSRLVVAIEEDFSKFTEGTEDQPASEPLATDWYGSFDESKVSVKGWGGNGVYEAGGCAFIKEGSALWSPTIDLTDAVNKRVTVSFRARLAADAEEGVPSVILSYDPTPLAPLTDEWQDYEIELAAFSGADFTFSATSDWLIDDVKIMKNIAYVATPSALTFSQYVGTGFRAIWQPVEGAHHYLVNVYSVDAALEKLTPVLLDIRANDTFCDITDLPEIDDLFCFSVTAVNAAGNQSEESLPLLVEALLTPQTYDATDVTPDGFSASWEAIDGAICYDFYVYRQADASEDCDFAIVDTDFSFITAETNSEEYSVSFDMLPGWIINVPMFEEGAIGMDGAKAPIFTTFFASMESPAYDLSAGGGEIEVTVSVRSTRGATVSFSLYTMKNGVYPVYPESYVTLESMPFEEYETRSFVLTGGGENSVLYVETADWGQVWISDLKIVQHVKAGETVSAPVVNYVTVDNSAIVTDVDLTDGYKYFYTVRAVGISRDEEYYISSDFTSPHYVAYDPAGIDKVAVGTSAAVFVENEMIIVDNPSQKPVSVFDISGNKIYESQSPAPREAVSVNHGCYIVQVGSETFKLIR